MRVEELARLEEAGAVPELLLFWGHRLPPGGGVGTGCLSQWYPAPFTVDGVRYATAEHFMMAGKARLFGDAEAERLLLGFALMEYAAGCATSSLRPRRGSDRPLRGLVPWRGRAV